MRVNLAFRETLRQVFHLWEILDGMRRNKKRQGCCWNVGISPSHSSTLPWRSPTFAPVSDSPIPLMVSRQHHQPKVAELSLAAARLGVDGVCIYIYMCVCVPNATTCTSFRLGNLFLVLSFFSSTSRSAGLLALRRLSSRSKRIGSKPRLASSTMRKAFWMVSFTVLFCEWGLISSGISTTGSCYNP